MNKTEAWYWANLQLLAQLMPDADITFDDEECTWILIDQFPLPANVYQDFSRLLITLPGINAPINKRPKAFYLDKGLLHSSGRPLEHVYNNETYHGCEDLSRYGYAWFCLLLDRWEPKYNVVTGDNIATVASTIFQKLKEM